MEFTKLCRKAAGTVPGLQSLVFESDRCGPGGGRGITLELSHTNTDILSRAGTELAEALALFPVVSDIDDGFADGKVQLDFSLLPQGINLGLTTSEVAAQMRGAYYGTEALRQQRGRNEVKVKVRLPEDERDSEYYLDRLLIQTPEGIDVPLNEVAQVTRGQAYTTIERTDGRRTITVSANVSPASEAERIVGETTKNKPPRVYGEVPGAILGLFGEAGSVPGEHLGAEYGIYLCPPDDLCPPRHPLPKIHPAADRNDRDPLRYNRSGDRPYHHGVQPELNEPDGHSRPLGGSGK